MKKLPYTSYFYFFIFSLSFFSYGCQEESEKPQPSFSSQKIAGSISTDMALNEVALPSASNTPPKIVSIDLTPRPVSPGTTIKVKVRTTGSDGYDTSFYFKWERNGELLFGEESDELDTLEFSKGDLIAVIVTPYNGEGKGATLKSSPLLLTNRPPEITSLPQSAFSNGKFIYEVKASDADSDTLSFSFEDAPSGMIIDQATGRIEWIVPTKLKDNINVRIIVSDGEASAFQEFAFSQHNK